VCSSVLQCIAVRRSVLQCVLVCCSALQCAAEGCSVLQCVAVECKTTQQFCTPMQHTAKLQYLRSPPIEGLRDQKFGHSFVLQYLQCVTVCCSVSQCATVFCTDHCYTPRHTATHCSKLQHIATHCNTLQHTATHNITIGGLRGPDFGHFADFACVHRQKYRQTDM